MAEDPWVTWEQAAVLVGCTKATIHRAVQSGELERRPDRSNATPSLSRASVRAMAVRWADEDRARAERAAARPAGLPPDDEHQWLNVEAAAALLEVSRVRVQQWVARGSIPHERVGRRIWLRWDHVEQVKAAREFRAWMAAERTKSAPPPGEG